MSSRIRIASLATVALPFVTNPYDGEIPVYQTVRDNIPHNTNPHEARSSVAVQMPRDSVEPLIPVRSTHIDCGGTAVAYDPGLGCTRPATPLEWYLNGCQAVSGHVSSSSGVGPGQTMVSPTQPH